ncbi:MAG TPA: acetyl-CoA carboxylase biotin carboxyl carrier protein [Cyclobacteriaceae bacterium]|nr:acetyl-CoA carboxylase biotin carboxyl carrier protein [Cyclobacteriaceae bacterium]HMV08645.1 acetyl-CoA carboxylase biotin carboxyl carrier protein [Cyclobacteriaceae bacterium]HMV91569.1 acetyl-CoA carboxylase biotin carboxyl carrier protein [Cyclobacteriaceae bacterium]HMX00146.1 acetyl-CoA carboxylase biotin carboxyl carrier protein [Cyclobacteriaceae bacterium]HMX52185.1 acetyl-CoA carboxylase biotin carboxyl carrier protein [Cyclobacteriaceae bacterium]
MKTTEIRDLIDFISKTGLNEVNVETKELKLHVKREPDQKVFKSVSAAPVQTVSAPVQQTTPQVAAQPQATKQAAETPVASGKKTVDIKSPMIGTFYRTANPESAPFVSVGDKVSKGQTVCIIEAMKLFNEIESEVSGTIVKVMVENASPVEYDQVLFVVEPD